MLIYSETSFAFIAKCEKYLKEIIENETAIEMRRNRFVLNQYLYPVHIVVFEGHNTLGYFDHHTYQIALNKNLMYSTKEKVLKDILRHEFAHYLTFIKYGSDIKAHGDEFKQVCSEHGWDNEVIAATANIEELNKKLEGDLTSERIISKVKKLLKLAQSENEHESQAATLKANKLLLKYNLELFESENFETLYVDQLMTQKRKSAKLMAIYDILKHFLVRPILSYGKGQVSLEATGTKANIELAQYIAHFLDEELERLWLQHKKATQSKGQRAKNSFFLGLAKGYDQKMQNLNSEFNEKESKELVTINKNLDLAVSKIYRRLSSTSSGSSIDQSSFGAGKAAGKNLTINQGIKNKNKSKLLGWLR